MMKISIFPTPSTQVPEILLHSFMCFDLGHSHIFLWRHGLGLNHWEAHVYLKGYKDGVRFSESTSSSNPNYQILHPGFWFQLITAPVEQILKKNHDVTTRWEQSIKASSQLLRATLLHKEAFFDDVIPVDYNFLRCGVAICGALTSHRMNSLSLKTTSRTCFLRRQVSAAAMFDETTFNLSQNETPRCTPLRKRPTRLENAMLNMLNVEKDWVTGISGYHGITSASSEVTQTYKKHVLNDRRKAFFFKQIARPRTKDVPNRQATRKSR